jgi:hypothetical protein
VLSDRFQTALLTHSGENRHIMNSIILVEGLRPFDSDYVQDVQVVNARWSSLLARIG